MPPAKTYITVTAPPHKSTPIHRNDGTAADGGLLIVDEDSIARVGYSQDVRRSIARGDLTPCDLNGNRVASAELAACPDDLPGGMTRIERRKAQTK